MRNERRERSKDYDERERRDDRERERERERERKTSSSGFSPIKRQKTSSSLPPPKEVPNVSRGNTASGGSTPSSSNKSSSNAYDVFKVTMDAIKAEEEKAIAADPSEDLVQFKSACDTIRTVCDDLIDAKRDKNTDRIDALKKKGSLTFLTLKTLNRFDKYRCRDARDKLQNVKQKVDTYHLQLQNMLYEVMHLQKECKTCQTFRSKDEDINLVPLEQFFSDAPQELAQKDLDAHKLHLARLEWELRQRKQLEEQLKHAELIKKKCEEEIGSKRETIDKLQPMLKSVVEATQPLHSQLKIPLQATEAAHASAEYLPRPLFVLYVQTVAYQHACKGNYEVKIVGNVEDAKSLNINANDFDADDDDRDEPDEDEGRLSKKSRHRKSISQASTAKATGLKKLVAAHPLSVIIKFQNQESTLTCQFLFILRLEIVTVKVSVQQNNANHSEVVNETLLLKLFADDDGITSPNPGNDFIINYYGVDNFSCLIDEIGYGYQWAQRLSGLDFITSDAKKASTALSVSWTDKAIKAISERFRSRLLLQQQLKDLDRGIVLLPHEVQALTYSQINCSIKEFKSIKKNNIFDDLHQNDQLQEAIDMGIINVNDCFVYTAKLERGSATLTALIIIPSDYPQNPPFFHLTLNWPSDSKSSSSLRELEEIINCSCPATISKSSDHQLLSYQMHRLQLGFDIYLEANQCTSGAEGPKEFSQKKIFSQLMSGRDHSKPYYYDKHHNMFIT